MKEDFILKNISISSEERREEREGESIQRKMAEDVDTMLIAATLTFMFAGAIIVVWICFLRFVSYDSDTSEEKLR